MNMPIALLRCSFVLAFWLFHSQNTDGVQLDPRVAKYVKLLVKEFTANPTCNRFDQVSLPPHTGELMIDYFYPKVFIWCPIAHNNLEIKCLLHNCPLKPGTFTDEVEKKSANNPRVVYDLRGNLLLIQRMYLC